MFQLGLSVLALAGLSSAAGTCAPKTFKKATPEVFGVEVLDIIADEVKGYTWNPQFASLPPLPVMPEALDFCNVTLLYTHPGLNDTVRVNVWLPQSDKWNGRFLGQGGGGWAAGMEGSLAGGVQMGFATANTDSGHSNLLDPYNNLLNSAHWSLPSAGNVNLHLLQNFAYRSIEDMTLIAKQLTQTYYGKDIQHSYFHGCSTGGRQGLVSAQRYPTLYQGVLSAAPAINWVTFLVTEYYAHVKMGELNYFPPACELNAITQAAIAACDEHDGVKDGVISAAGLCNFDPHSVVGQKFDCDGDSRKITKEAATIAATVWSGPVKDGKPVWHGLAHEASLPGVDPLFTGLAATTCDKNNKNCKSAPFGISADWIKHFNLKDTSADLTKIDEDQFYHILRQSRQQYHSIMDSADPDLNLFKQAGGKIISWHGLADQLIPPNGTSNYYERVEQVVPDIRSFYKHFEVPGVQHCFGGPGAFPAGAIHQLMDWVETGHSPEFLAAATMPALMGRPEDPPVNRKLCPWPQVAVFQGGDNTKAESFECRDKFDGVKTSTHDEL